MSVFKEGVHGKKSLGGETIWISGKDSPGICTLGTKFGVVLGPVPGLLHPRGGRGGEIKKGRGGGSCVNRIMHKKELQQTTQSQKREKVRGA